ncbi:MAG TPA: hypothetical protein VMV38_02205 [Candidatus Paceibacterota bacterium]|nr:hypothetical protein [Candidatus Paceibacterota bacterium]
MKNIFEHIEHIKGKPHQVRKNIALATAAFGSALIAFVWLVGNTVSGSFALKGTSFAALAQPNIIATTTSISDTQTELAGVGAAGALQGPTAPAHIEIVDTTPAPSSQKSAEQTTLPF